ncbi:MAG: ThuA domain-containing protein [Defluviitaleaceae bacterium]|nr:ThuA domain-containing protein [Defluviitaleaceae bacterium]
MKILLFCDDYYHPQSVPVGGMKPLEEKGFVVDVVADAEVFDPSVIVGYDVVVMSKCDHVSQENNSAWKTAEVQAALVGFVESGGGLVVTHSGTVAGEDGATDVLDALVGCRFSSHPNNCAVTVGMLKPHPVTEGVGIFCEVDEHYHLEILNDDIDILAASYAAKQGEESKYESEPYFNAPEFIAPAVYVRRQGKGRVCVITPGHVLEVWLNAEFSKLLENAVRWCGEGRVRV